MNEYGHIIMNIEQILKNKGISKIKYAKNWIYLDLILIDIAKILFKGSMQILFVNYVIILSVT